MEICVGSRYEVVGICRYMVYGIWRISRVVICIMYKHHDKSVVNNIEQSD